MLRRTAPRERGRLILRLLRETNILDQPNSDDNERDTLDPTRRDSDIRVRTLRIRRPKMRDR